MPEPETLDEWIATRPPEVRALAERFPFDAEYTIDGRRYYLLGFSAVERGDTPMLILSLINPRKNYAAAMRDRIYVCIDHETDGRLTVTH